MNIVNLDYIGATGEVPFIEDIINTNNNIETKINFTNSLIYQENEVVNVLGSNITLTNTYVYNPNIGGEIRFFIPVEFYDPIDNYTNQPYRVKIDTTGQLYLFYTYNFSFSATEPTGWKNIIVELIRTKAGVAGVGIGLAGLQGEVFALTTYVNVINNNFTSISDKLNQTIGVLNKDVLPYIANLRALETIELLSLQTGYPIIENSITNMMGRFWYNGFLQNPITVGLTGAGALIYGIAYGAMNANHNATFIENTILNHYNNNSNLTSDDRSNLLDLGSNLYISTLDAFIVNTCNLNKSIGFINSNTITTQFIPNINTSNLSINNINIIDIINSNITNNSNAIIANVNTNVNNNFSKISRIFIPNTLFVYDTNNLCYTYDLDISKYVNFDLVYGGLGNPIYFKTRIFRINSYMSSDWVNLDFNNKNHLSGNAICYPETLTIFMSNNKYYNNIHTAEDNYCNGLILGKLNEKSSGYWNIIPNNFNYIRFISAQGFDMKVIIQPLQN